MKLFKSLLLLSASLLLVGCKNSPSEGNSQSSGDTQSESSSSSEEAKTLHTLSLSTYGDSWKGEFSAGTGFGGDYNAANNERLVSYLGGPDAFIDSIVIPDTVTSLAYGDHSNEVALALGGGTAYGTMNFTFNVDVDVIRLSVESYYKTYDTYEGDPLNGLSLDTNSALALISGTNEDLIDLKTTQEEGKKTENITFNLANKRSLSLQNMSNNKGRVMIKSIYFEYWK